MPRILGAAPAGGLDKDQILPWEIRHTNMREGEYGKKLYRLELAKTLFDDGLGQFDLDSEKPRLIFTKKEFQDWYEKNVESKGITFANYLNKKVPSGFKYVAHTVRGSLEILFGEKIRELYSAKKMVLNINHDNFDLVFEPIEYFISNKDSAS